MRNERMEERMLNHMNQEREKERNGERKRMREVCLESRRGLLFPVVSFSPFLHIDTNWKQGKYLSHHAPSLSICFFTIFSSFFLQFLSSISSSFLSVSLFLYHHHLKYHLSSSLSPSFRRSWIQNHHHSFDDCHETQGEAFLQGKEKELGPQNAFFLAPLPLSFSSLPLSLSLYECSFLRSFCS